MVAVETDYRTGIQGIVILADRTSVGDDRRIEGLQEWCKAELQRYECPYVVDFVDDFPRTATGKVQRFKLRDS